ncbi:MAG: succinate dehydrogenase, cytochrome b556 subunit [Gammaproteobacteria bacterium]|nr:succinate dehydrogenase, cytochrome b556 subunit [Gammaproteobacteria bacterium]
MVNNRPVNLDLRTIRMPATAILSILHRITGVIIFLGMPILLWMLGKSLGSAAEFHDLLTLLDNIFLKIIFLGTITALGYHVIAGIKHLFMDRGIGETLEGSKVAGRLVMVATLILLIIIGSLL